MRSRHSSGSRVSFPGAQITWDKVRHTLQAGATEVSGQRRGPSPLTYLQLGEFTAQETHRTKALCAARDAGKGCRCKRWGNWRLDKEQLQLASPAAGILTPPRKGANPLLLHKPSPTARRQLSPRCRLVVLSNINIASSTCKEKGSDQIIAVAKSIH